MSIAAPTYDFNGLLSPAFSKAIHGDDTEEIPNFSIPIDIFRVDVEAFLEECEKLSKAKPQKPQKMEKANAEILESIRATRKPLGQLNSNAVDARLNGRAKKTFVELNQPPIINRNFKMLRPNML